MSGLFVFFFFFSSRRRHTRWPRDWSSDVCSSDLATRFEFAEAVEWKRQVDVRANRLVIEGVAAVRFNQQASFNRIRDFAERRVTPFIRAVEIALIGRPQAGGRDQRDTRFAERLRQTRAWRRFNRVARERVTFHEEPDV